MRKPMFRVACAYLRQEQDRADAVQEALLRAWKNLPSLRQEQYFGTWLMRILIRECIAIQRRQRRVMPMETLPERAAQEEGQRREVREAILALPENLRIVIVLFYMEGYGTGEIARILHIPKGTVCARLSRARQQMKLSWEEEAEQ